MATNSITFFVFLAMVLTVVVDASSPIKDKAGQLHHKYENKDRKTSFPSVTREILDFNLGNLNDAMEKAYEVSKRSTLWANRTIYFLLPDNEEAHIRIHDSFQYAQNQNTISYYRYVRLVESWLEKEEVPPVARETTDLILSRITEATLKTEEIFNEVAVDLLGKVKGIDQQLIIDVKEIIQPVLDIIKNDKR